VGHAEQSISYHERMIDQNNPLLPIFQLKHLDELAAYCTGLEVSSRDLLELVLHSRAGHFEPYNYVAHIVDAVPDEIPLTKDDLNVLTRAQSGVSMSARDERLITQVFTSTDTSKLYAAHLFYTTSCEFWYAFCFNKGDQAYIHLITGHSRLSLEDAWAKITARKLDLPALRIGFNQQR
jgi:hypothetical protein